MNSKELRIYTALTHPTSPESYRITDDGTRLWSIAQGALIFFEGEYLDRMSATSLYHWYHKELRKYHENFWDRA